MKGKDAWIGLKSVNKRLISLEGQDVTNTYFGFLSNLKIIEEAVANTGCGTFSFASGYPRVVVADCALEKEFYCELNLMPEEQQTSIQKAILIG